MFEIGDEVVVVKNFFENWISKKCKVLDIDYEYGTERLKIEDPDKQGYYLISPSDNFQLVSRTKKEPSWRL